MAFTDDMSVDELHKEVYRLTDAVYDLDCQREALEIENRQLRQDYDATWADLESARELIEALRAENASLKDALNSYGTAV